MFPNIFVEMPFLLRRHPLRPVAGSRDDRMFVVKVYYKIERSPWALTLTEPVPEAFELPASDFFLVNQRREGAG